jgi:hypothetical protein
LSNDQEENMANIAVFGIYANRPAVEGAVSTFRRAGFRSEDISVLLPSNTGTKELAHELHTKVPEGAAAGVASGAVLGGALGWLVGVGALVIPGLGPFLAAGPLMAALGGVGVGAAVGGVTGALIGLGIPEYEAKRYEGLIRSGNILMSVHADDTDWVKRAKELFEETGATDVRSASEAEGDFANSERPRRRAPGT